MNFDPNLPIEDTLIDAAELRSQFNGLKALIDEITPVTEAQVDDVTTLPPGEEATASASVSGSMLHLSFSLPQGESGEVSEERLQEALTTKAHQVTGVDPLDLTPEMDYQPAQLQAVVEKLNELLQALKQEGE